MKLTDQDNFSLIVVGITRERGKYPSMEAAMYCEITELNEKTPQKNSS